MIFYYGLNRLTDIGKCLIIATSEI